jgi:DNA-binding transcriptional MerR regulator
VDADLPDKQYFKIGEVSRLTALNTSVLRFWENEFAQLQPLKSKSGQRLYTKHDLEIIYQIKRLLYDEKLTIAGAKKKLLVAGAEVRTVAVAKRTEINRKLLAEVMEELRQVLDSF